MAEPDPVLDALSRSATGRARLRDLVAASLYAAERREWAERDPGGDPATFVGAWTSKRVEGLRERADLLLDAESRARSRGRRTAWSAVRRLIASALAGLALLAVLTLVGVGALRWSGVDVGAALFQACVPMAPPRYVGQRR